MLVSPLRVLCVVMKHFRKDDYDNMYTLQRNSTYEVTKQIKLHTKPTRIAQIKQTGAFIGESEYYLFFHGFRVRKANVVSIFERW